MLPATHVASQACCQPRKLLATHALCSRPRAAGNAQPAPHALSRRNVCSAHPQAAPGAGRPACRPAHADLARERLRLMPGLTTSATSTTSSTPSSSSTSTSSTSAAPSGPRAFFAGEPREGAIPVFRWQGGLLGSGPWPAPGAPPAGPAGLRRAVALHRSRAAVAIRGPCGPSDSIFFYRTLTIRF